MLTWRQRILFRNLQYCSILKFDWVGSLKHSALMFAIVFSSKFNCSTAMDRMFWSEICRANRFTTLSVKGDSARVSSGCKRQIHCIKIYVVLPRFEEEPNGNTEHSMPLARRRGGFNSD